MSIVIQEDSKAYVFNVSCKNGNPTTTLDLDQSGTPTMTLRLYSPFANASYDFTMTVVDASAGTCSYSTAITNIPNPDRWTGQVFWRDGTHDMGSELFPVIVNRNLPAPA